MIEIVRDKFVYFGPSELWGLDAISEKPKPISETMLPLRRIEEVSAQTNSPRAVKKQGFRSCIHLNNGASLYSYRRVSELSEILFKGSSAGVDDANGDAEDRNNA